MSKNSDLALVLDTTGAKLIPYVGAGPAFGPTVKDALDQLSSAVSTLSFSGTAGSTSLVPLTLRSSDVTYNGIGPAIGPTVYDALNQINAWQGSGNTGTGYATLASGTLLQWGSVISNVSNSGGLNYVQSFALPFPTAVFVVMAQAMPRLTDGLLLVYVAAATRTGFQVTLSVPSPGPSGDVPNPLLFTTGNWVWFAIGH